MGSGLFLQVLLTLYGLGSIGLLGVEGYTMVSGSGSRVKELFFFFLRFGVHGLCIVVVGLSPGLRVIIGVSVFRGYLGLSEN